MRSPTRPRGEGASLPRQPDLLAGPRLRRRGPRRARARITDGGGRRATRAAARAADYIARVAEARAWASRSRETLSPREAARGAAVEAGCAHQPRACRWSDVAALEIAPRPDRRARGAWACWPTTRGGLRATAAGRLVPDRLTHRAGALGARVERPGTRTLRHGLPDLPPPALDGSAPGAWALRGGDAGRQTCATSRCGPSTCWRARTWCWPRTPAWPASCCSAYGLWKAQLERYDEHGAGRATRPKAMAALAAGKTRGAGLRRAGTPLVSDPGYKLVREAAAEGCRGVPDPRSAVEPCWPGSAAEPAHRPVPVRGLRRRRCAARRDLPGGAGRLIRSPPWCSSEGAASRLAAEPGRHGRGAGREPARRWSAAS